MSMNFNTFILILIFGFVIIYVVYFITNMNQPTNYSCRYTNDNSNNNYDNKNIENIDREYFGESNGPANTGTPNKTPNTTPNTTPISDAISEAKGTTINQVNGVSPNGTGYFNRTGDNMCINDKSSNSTNEYEKDKYYYNIVEKVNQIRDDENPFIGHPTYTGTPLADQDISTIYDELTNNKCYEKKCIKKPIMDMYSDMPVYYSDNYGPRSIKNDQWAYQDECVSNGGKFDTNLYAIDPSDDYRLAI